MVTGFSNNVLETHGLDIYWLGWSDNSWKLLLLPSVKFRNTSKMILEDVNAETLMISNNNNSNNNNSANVNANNILFLYSATSNYSYFFTIA